MPAITRSQTKNITNTTSITKSITSITITEWLENISYNKMNKYRELNNTLNHCLSLWNTRRYKVKHDDLKKRIFNLIYEKMREITEIMHLIAEYYPLSNLREKEDIFIIYNNTREIYDKLFQQIHAIHASANDNDTDDTKDKIIRAGIATFNDVNNMFIDMLPNNDVASSSSSNYWKKIKTGNHTRFIYL